MAAGDTGAQARQRGVLVPAVRTAQSEAPCRPTLTGFASKAADKFPVLNVAATIET